ncbi:MAG: hypothetical protein JWQ04_2670 [Pedosphaera sp.]|nr:hypothetical protein [Pedosphaera sp.]
MITNDPHRLPAHFLRVSALVLITCAVFQAPAATVWTGPTMSYSQPAPDPTQAANQDRLTDRVWLTRASTQGLFNEVIEGSFDKIGFSSPADTEWAYGTLANRATLTYTTWAAMSGKNPMSMVGQPAVVHLITDDIYLAVTFTFWGGPGGGFAYDRSTPAMVTPPPAVDITNPANGAVFAAPASVKLAANATVSSGTVTNVTFFSNTNKLGSVTAAPFNLSTGSLSAGSYALTAVATAAGVSTTSAPVNISVVTPVAVAVSAPKIISNQFSFNYSANPGLGYEVQSSSNLLTWVPLSTNVAAGNPVHFTDNLLSNGSRFYRVGRLPDP